MKKIWYDCFNEEFIFDEADVQRLRNGGNKLVPLIVGNFTDVQAFHDRFGLERDRPATPRAALPEALARFRLGFLLEELSEYARAAGHGAAALQLSRIGSDVANGTLRYEPEAARAVDAFDGLLDLVVVALGTADFHGFPWEAGWDIVMARNMAKKRAEPDGSDSKRGSPWDVVKPPGWYGPEAELRALLTKAEPLREGPLTFSQETLDKLKGERP